VQVLADRDDEHAEDVRLSGATREQAERGEREHDPAVEQAVVDAQRERVSEAGSVHARATRSMNGKSVEKPSERPQSAARRPHCGPGARAGEAVRANSQTCSPHNRAPTTSARGGSALASLRHLTVWEATRVLPRNRGRRRSLSGTIHASRERWLPGTGDAS